MRYKCEWSWEDESFEIFGGSLTGDNKSFTGAMKKRGIKVVKRGNSSDYNILIDDDRKNVESFLDSLNAKEMNI